MKVINKILTFLLLLGVLACAIGVFLKYTDVGKDVTDFFDTTFYVEYNGRKYQGTDNSITLPRGKEIRFGVSSLQGYSVSVTTNAPDSANFTYTVDGQAGILNSKTNLTKAFLSAENVDADGFTLNAMESLSYESVLSKLYDGKTVVVDNYDFPYLLTVTSGNEKIQFTIQ